MMLYLAIILFFTGLYLVLTKRNTILVLAGIELMLNSANLNLVYFSDLYPVKQVEAQLLVLMIIVVAAAESVIALALFSRVYRYMKTSDLDSISRLK
jgi:NADH-quinone oxidoreductase subunit K